MKLHPLVPNARLPFRAVAAVRSPIPAGYGVQEQCVPFVAASAMGLLIPAPFSFGICRPDEVPTEGRAFDPPPIARPAGDPRCFYVVDDASCQFSGNSFAVEPVLVPDDAGATREIRPLVPGVSFFDRNDQAGLFKIHLPWVLRTDEGLDSLYMAPINRQSPLEVIAGLVETDWYAHPVNLVVRRPSQSLHVRGGDVLAQVIITTRELRRQSVDVVDSASGDAEEQRAALGRWFAAHHLDRSAYRHLARESRGTPERAESAEEKP